MRFATRHNPRLLLWPLAGFLLCLLACVNPFYKPPIGIPTCLACLAANFVLTLWLCRSPLGARLAILLSGLAMCVPCFLQAKPLERGLIMFLVALPFVFAAMIIPRPAMPTLRARIAFLTAQFSDGCAIHLPRRFNTTACLQMFLGTAIFTLMMMTVKNTPAHGGWYALRWLAGGILFLAVGEIFTGCNAFWAATTGVACPRLFRSPWLATSAGDFWATRWNLPTSRMFYRNCFVFLAPSNIWLATIAVFFASAVIHLALAYMATLDWPLSICFGLFFLVQPLLIAAERTLAIRRRPVALARIWTFVALGLTCPLFVEPVIQVAGPDWGGPDIWFAPTVWSFGAIFVFCGIIALAAAISKSEATSQAPLGAKSL